MNRKAVQPVQRGAQRFQIFAVLGLALVEEIIGADQAVIVVHRAIALIVGEPPRRGLQGQRELVVWRFGDRSLRG